MAKLNSRVWNNSKLKLTKNTKLRIYQAIPSLQQRDMDHLQKAVKATQQFAILSKRRFTWLGHLQLMDPGRIQRTYCMENQQRSMISRLRYKDICKRDMKLSDIDVNRWESYVGDCAKWRSTVRESVMRAEERRCAEQVDKRRRWKQRRRSFLLPTNHRCSCWGKDCHSKIDLHSHSRKCQKNRDGRMPIIYASTFFTN